MKQLGNMLRLIIIEDQRLVQQSLLSALREHLNVELVGGFQSAKAALAQPAVLQCGEVALLDLQLGEEQAFDAVPEIRRIAPGLKLIWVTSVATEYLVSRAFDAGLEGFVHKDDAISVLVTAIERVAAGGRFVSETVLAMQARFRQKPNHFQKLLSPREQELLELLSQGLSNQEAAALLGLSPGTIQAHRRNIMARLDLHSLAELQAYGLKSGFTTPEKLNRPGRANEGAARACLPLQR
jgi:Response regulator containing a CheY-like receiver domain and an HTH DNA-binding domain